MTFDKKLIKNILILVASVFILASAFVSFILYETQDEVMATPDNIESKLNAYFNEKEMAGFAVSVFDADTCYFQGGIGYADIEKKVPYTSKTLQYTASLCKTMIGICLLKAEELGYLKLSHSVNQYLPFEVINPHHPQLEITLQHLATHTSSLDYNEEVVESLYILEKDKKASLTGFMEDYFVKGKYGEIAFTEDKPGNNWNYSNIGAGLAAYVIEYTSGISFAEFTQKYIFDPLEMEQSGWFQASDSFARHASYYELVENRLDKVDAKGVKLYPARDLLTNVEELTQYAQAILRQDARLLSPDSYDKMLSPMLDKSVSNLEIDNHGIFWMIDRNNYGIVYQLMGMNGGDSYINTMMWLDRKTGMGYIFLGNTGKSEASRANHIWIYRALVSLGDHVLMENPTADLWDKLGYAWHNVSSRVGALF